MYLYVMGRGHSGSTILDIVLGGGAAVESVGEVVSGLLRYDAAEPCSCGALMRECVYWTEVRRRFEAAGHDWAEFAKLNGRQTDVRRWLGTRLASPADPERQRLAAMVGAFAAAVSSVAGKPHVLDSNKETSRGLFLLRFVPEARVVHLVRDPRGIAQSHHWRVAGGHGFKFMRRRYAAGRSGPLFLVLSAVSWTVGNALCEMARRVAPDRVLRVRYEDLRDSPVATLRAIGTAFGIPVDDVVGRVERGDRFEVGHNVGGNQIRHARAVRFDPGAERARPALPRWAAITTLFLCWPLMRRYGYAAAWPARGATAASAESAKPQGAA